MNQKTTAATANRIASVLAGIGAPLPWPCLRPFSAAGAAAGLSAGTAAGLSGGAGQVTAPSLITVRPRMASSSILTRATPSLALHSSSIRRSRLVAYSVEDCFARHGQFAVAALFAGHVNDDAARLHGLHHLGGDELGGGLAGNQRGGDDDV